MSRGVTWYADRVARFTTTGPAQAFKLAAAASAGVAARSVHSRATGTLARDVSRPTFLGLMHAEIGSDLPYAAAENWGAEIRAKSGGRLLIRGNRTARSSAGGDVVASAESVQHRGKHYLEAGQSVFTGLFIASLRKVLS